MNKYKSFKHIENSEKPSEHKKELKKFKKRYIKLKMVKSHLEDIENGQKYYSHQQYFDVLKLVKDMIQAKE